MFRSFFPRPGMFFLSAAVWALLCVFGWFLLAKDHGNSVSLGGIFGLEFPAMIADDADDGAKAAFAAANKSANSFWLYQYMTVCYVLFAAFWYFVFPHKWRNWSVLGSTLIIFVTWYRVRLDVLINEWFGSFYNIIQETLADADAVTDTEYYAQIFTFGKIAAVYVMVTVLWLFLLKHYVFRWRTAMNDYYMARWEKLRKIEGASQRVQEDTMKFADLMQTLGVSLIDSVMTLIAFLPILWTLSVHVKEVPILGAIPQALVVIAVAWALIGTIILALTGIKLPGLEFRNQRVEAAFRKELVLGEDSADHAQPPTVASLFANVRRNYFRLYFHYMYFDVVRYSYLQASVLVPYIALAPTLVAAGVTLGVMQQIVRAFGRVEQSFQYLVHSWPSIVSMLSIYKRLQAFEAAIADQPLPAIDRDYTADTRTMR